MAKKFTVGGNMEGTTQRTVLPNRQITGSEQSKAMAAMDANTRLQKIGDRLLKAYETVGMSGLSLNLFKRLSTYSSISMRISRIARL